MITYQVTAESFGIQLIKKIDGGIIYWIPADEQNKDYQEYQIWLHQGNTPQSAN